MAFLIGIAGPSGAGKSTFCRRMEGSHANVGRLKLDDFFCDASQVEIVNGYQNWDDPKHIFWNQLISAAQTLKSGASATIPHYDRANDRTVGSKCILPKEIVLVDGFMTLVHPDLRALFDLSVYFDLSEALQITRRRERQSWVEEGYLHTIMLPSARKYIIPTKAYATHVVSAELSPTDLYHEILEKISESILPISKGRAG